VAGLNWQETAAETEGNGNVSALTLIAVVGVGLFM
jgi:hypothetical protein